jgi:hypothetical protein
VRVWYRFDEFRTRSSTSYNLSVSPSFNNGTVRL